MRFTKFVLSDLYIRLASVLYSRWNIIPTGGQVKPLGTSSNSYEGNIQIIPTERLPVP